MQAYTASIEAFPRLTGESSDTLRFRRAVSACPGGRIWIPRGEYTLDAPIALENGASLAFHKSARITGSPIVDSMFLVRGADSSITGGLLDARGGAYCIRVEGNCAFALSNSTLRNAKDTFLLANEADAPLTVTNVYLHSTMQGLKGSTAINTRRTAILTDIIVVDVTRGIAVEGGTDSLLTRCHIWGGIIPAREAGGIREMLEDSICYHILPAAKGTRLVDSYADSGAIGFLVEGDTVLQGCSYYNNYEAFKLDHVVCIDHLSGHLVVEDGYFSRTAPSTTFYRGTGTDLELYDPMGRGGINLTEGVDA